MINRKTFQKGTLPHFSNTLHKIEDKNIHSYKLDNGKWFMYYELQSVPETEKKETRMQKITRQ